MNENIVYMSKCILWIVVVMLVFSSFQMKEREVGNPSLNKLCWNRIKVACSSTEKYTVYDGTHIPYPSTITLDPNQIDSLGQSIRVENIDSNTILTVKIFTSWISNTKSGVVEQKIVAIDSVLERYRWECSFVGNGKGNCDTCQATNCEGVNVGVRKKCK